MKKLILLLAVLISSVTLFSQNVGIDQTTPVNKLDVNGRLSVGSTYSGTFIAPTNGAIIEGNVGIGTEAPQATLDVNGTLRVGRIELYPNVGNHNTFVGRETGLNTTGSTNTFIGSRAGFSNTSGESNTFLGWDAGYFNSTGSDNVFIGRQTGVFNTNKGRNVYIGSRAGRSSPGGGSILIGYEAGINEPDSNRLYIENSGSDKPLIYGEFDNDYLRINGRMGIGTLPDPIQGSILSVVDTFNGFSDGVIRGEFVCDSASFNHKPGIFGQNIVDQNYGIGVRGVGGWRGVEGFVLTTGPNDYIGVRALVFNTKGQGTAENCGIFGSAQGDSSFNYGVYGHTFGNGGTNYAGYFVGDVGYTGTLIPPSDMRLKKDVSPLQNALKKVLALQPKNYHFKTEEFKQMNLADGPQIGFIAQEAGTIFPQLMHENVFANPSEDVENRTDPIEYVGFDYMSLIPVLTGAIQEQQEMIDTQKNEIQELKTQLESIVSALKKAGIELK